MSDRREGTAGYSKLLWLVATVATLILAVYQRMTGPTYPLRGRAVLSTGTIGFKLPRSADCGSPAVVQLAVPPGVRGTLRYRRYLSDDDWVELPMQRVDGKVLVGTLPEQPPAGKLSYFVRLTDSGASEPLSLSGDDPIVLRFKGPVPPLVLIPHIFFMFAAMVAAARAGLEALCRHGEPSRFVVWTTCFLLGGAFVFGPLVQKYAFGAFWTGWPFGTDLTDNKALLALAFWLAALYATSRACDGEAPPGRAPCRPAARFIVVVAFLVMFAVYLVPHSMWGSEIDHRTGRAVNAAPASVPGR